MNRVIATMGLFSIGACALLLVFAHFGTESKEFSPLHNWLSEFVLSQSPAVQLSMRISFVLFSLAALSVALLNKRRVVMLLFGVASAALMFMTFTDTDPNDGKKYALSWPLTQGNVHQICLYIAMGGAILGMARVTWARTPPKASAPAIETVAIVTTLLATAVQSFLVYLGDRNRSPVVFGGLTERIIVFAVFIWVASFCSRSRD